MTDDRTARMLAARAAQAASSTSQSPASPQASSAPAATAAGPKGQREWGAKDNQGGDFTFTIVPPGTPKDQLRAQRHSVGGPPGGAVQVGGDRRSRRGGGGNVTASSGRGGVSNVTHRTGPAGGAVQVVNQTRSSTGERATVMPAGSPTPSAGPPTVMQPAEPGADLTIVLSVHSRPQFLPIQLRLLLAQTCQPVTYVAWCNPTEGMTVTEQQIQVIDSMPNVKANVDMGPWQRWYLAASCRTEFVCMIDDDCMPGPKWIGEAVQRLSQLAEHSVVAAAGIRYRTDRFDDLERIGPEAPPTTEIEVDCGRGAWMMRTETARMIAARVPLTEELSTGLHVAAVVQEAGGLTVVLPYPAGDKQHWGTMDPPKMEGSISAYIDAQFGANLLPQGSAQVREMIYRGYRDEGWLPWAVIDAQAPTVPIPAGSV